MKGAAPARAKIRLLVRGTHSHDTHALTDARTDRRTHTFVHTTDALDIYRERDMKNTTFHLYCCSDASCNVVRLVPMPQRGGNNKKYIPYHNQTPAGRTSCHRPSHTDISDTILSSNSCHTRLVPFHVIPRRLPPVGRPSASMIIETHQ